MQHGASKRCTAAAAADGAVDRRAGVRGALLHTLPGRAIVVGLAIKLVVCRSARTLGRDSVADVRQRRRHRRGPGDRRSGAPTSSFRLIVLAKRRLLWRVRRKLILSYIFIGFVPALLIVAFFLLCGLLLFYNFSSYLVQSRLRALADQARFLAPEHRARDPARRRARRRRHPRAPAGERRRASSPACRLPSCRWIARACELEPASLGHHESRAAGRASASSGHRRAVGACRPADARSPAWIDCAGFAGVPGLHACRDRRDSATGDGSSRHAPARARRRVSRFAAPGYAVVVDLLDQRVDRAAAAARDRRRAEERERRRDRRDGRQREAAARAATAATTAAPSPRDAGHPELRAEPDGVSRLDDRRARHADGVDVSSASASSTTASRRRRAASARTLRPGRCCSSCS